MEVPLAGVSLVDRLTEQRAYISTEQRQKNLRRESARPNVALQTTACPMGTELPIISKTSSHHSSKSRGN